MTRAIPTTDSSDAVDTTFLIPTFEPGDSPGTTTRFPSRWPISSARSSRATLEAQIATRSRGSRRSMRSAEFSPISASSHTTPRPTHSRSRSLRTASLRHRRERTVRRTGKSGPFVSHPAGLEHDCSRDDDPSRQDRHSRQCVVRLPGRARPQRHWPRRRRDQLAPNLKLARHMDCRLVSRGLVRPSRRPAVGGDRAGSIQRSRPQRFDEHEVAPTRRPPRLLSSSPHPTRPSPHLGGATPTSTQDRPISPTRCPPRRVAPLSRTAGRSSSPIRGLAI